jgi:endonuclease III
VVRRLSTRYGDPRHHNQVDPLDELIFIILSGKTTEESYLKTFAALKRRFHSWSDALVGEPADLELMIAPGGLSQKKGNQIRRLLSMIKASQGAVDLSFLRSAETGAVEEFLSALPGVGKKTAKCVAMYSLGRRSFPVDTHLRRILTRLGIAGITRLDDKAQDFIEAAIPPDLRYKLHVNGLALGRELCLPRIPHCSECPVNGACDYASVITGTSDTNPVQARLVAESSV